MQIQQNKIDTITHNELNKINLDKIVKSFDFLLKRNIPEIDQYQTKGINILKEKINYHIQQNVPIKFIMPGFPCKSPNIKDKVLGILPDKAEEVALTRIEKFLTKIQQEYSPGAEFCIISDGLIFGDIIGVSDETIIQYHQMIKEMTPTPRIKWFTLQSFYDSKNLDACREQLMKEYGSSNKELDDVINNNEDQKMLYCGMTKFLEEDRIWGEDMSKSQVHKIAKRQSKEMIRRNQAYNKLIKETFTNIIRFSIHPNTNSGEKYSANLVGSDSWASPWHRALLENNDSSYQLIKRSDAEKTGYKLIYNKVTKQPHYYTEN